MSRHKKREQAFVEDIRRTLEERNATLSPEILGKLNAINLDLGAVDHAQSQGNQKLLRMFAAGLVGAVMILLLALLFYPGKEPIMSSLDDLDILTAQETPDFFIDLEFYAWLESAGHEDENDFRTVEE